MAYVGVALGLRGTRRDRHEPAGGGLPARQAAAHRALELDDELGDAHSVLAYMMFAADFDWGEPKANSGARWSWRPAARTSTTIYARLCSALGRHDEAIAHADAGAGTRSARAPGGSRDGVLAGGLERSSARGRAARGRTRSPVRAGPRHGRLGAREEGRVRGGDPRCESAVAIDSGGHHVAGAAGAGARHGGPGRAAHGKFSVDWSRRRRSDLSRRTTSRTSLRGSATPSVRSIASSMRTRTGRERCTASRARFCSQRCIRIRGSSSCCAR